MSKILVKVKSGNGGFCDLSKNEPVRILPHRPYVVEKSFAIDVAVSNGTLTIIQDSLPEYATDELWKNLFKSSKTVESALNKLKKFKSNDEGSQEQNKEEGSQGQNKEEGSQEQNKEEGSQEQNNKN